MKKEWQGPNLAKMEIDKEHRLAIKAAYDEHATAITQAHILLSLTMENARTALDKSVQAAHAQLRAQLRRSEHEATVRRDAIHAA